MNRSSETMSIASVRVSTSPPAEVMAVLSLALAPPVNRAAANMAAARERRFMLLSFVADGRCDQDVQVACGPPVAVADLEAGRRDPPDAGLAEADDGPRIELVDDQVEAADRRAPVAAGG